MNVVDMDSGKRSLDEQRLVDAGADNLGVFTNERMTQSVRIFLTKDNNLVVYVIEGMPPSSTDHSPSEEEISHLEQKARRKAKRISLE